MDIFKYMCTFFFSGNSFKYTDLKRTQLVLSHISQISAIIAATKKILVKIDYHVIYLYWNVRKHSINK